MQMQTRLKTDDLHTRLKQVTASRFLLFIAVGSACCIYNNSKY